MLLNSLPLSANSGDCSDEDYARQYNADFVERWDELIDWDKRAQGEGTFFTDLLLKAGACRVLDVSTGSGFHAAQLRIAGFDVTACDGSPTMVDRANANFRSRGLDIPTICRDWRELDPLTLGTFDAVLCLGSSLCHVFDEKDRIDVLQRFRRLLNPGGLLLVDQRNFQAILAGRFSSSGRYYYCGKSATVTLGELNERLCEFVYTFADGACFRLRVFPILPQQLRHELSQAGFAVKHSFGDFKPMQDPQAPDFIIHHAVVQPERPEEALPIHSHRPASVSPHTLLAYPFAHNALSEGIPTPHVVWLTGLSAAGKSTLVDALNPVLRARGVRTCILDGDSLRSGLCRDLGFSAHDRDENVRRVAEVAALMAGAGLTVLVALISPTRSARHYARSIIGNERFVEVFVDAPLAVVEARDPKGLYRRARQGDIRGFTGIDSAYEAPVCPELHIRSDQVGVSEAVALIDAWLKHSRGL